MQVVIDTNVLISSTLEPRGNPAAIIKLISDKRVQLFLCAEILDEYKRVLAYKRLNISTPTQEKVIALVTELGVMIEPVASTITLPDESDRCFYDTAKSSGSTLVTGNTKHFPAEPFIVTPSDFLSSYNAQASKAEDTL